ncbi:Conserved_hypothetical protein [Hexamita inflata]|uniref:Uncharacterized protein n=1 Tax=Hexamita inflata TaxID=28002 RepID=A0AA86Q8A3_9EUKA|nr:Conserved hypothetical protein [Hexamita inflata]
MQNLLTECDDTDNIFSHQSTQNIVKEQKTHKEVCQLSQQPLDIAKFMIQEISNKCTSKQVIVIEQLIQTYVTYIFKHITQIDIKIQIITYSFKKVIENAVELGVFASQQIIQSLYETLMQQDIQNLLPQILKIIKKENLSQQEALTKLVKRTIVNDYVKPQMEIILQQKDQFKLNNLMNISYKLTPLIIEDDIYLNMQFYCINQVKQFSQTLKDIQLLAESKQQQIINIYLAELTSEQSDIIQVILKNFVCFQPKSPNKLFSFLSLFLMQSSDKWQYINFLIFSGQQINSSVSQSSFSLFNKPITNLQRQHLVQEVGKSGSAFVIFNFLFNTTDVSKVRQIVRQSDQLDLCLVICEIFSVMSPYLIPTLFVQVIPYLTQRDQSQLCVHLLKRHVGMNLDFMLPVLINTDLKLDNLPFPLTISFTQMLIQQSFLKTLSIIQDSFLESEKEQIRAQISQNKFQFEPFLVSEAMKAINFGYFSELDSIHSKHELLNVFEFEALRDLRTRISQVPIKEFWVQVGFAPGAQLNEENELFEGVYKAKLFQLKKLIKAAKKQIDLVQYSEAQIARSVIDTVINEVQQNSLNTELACKIIQKFITYKKIEALRTKEIIIEKLVSGVEWIGDALNGMGW